MNSWCIRTVMERYWGQMALILLRIVTETCVLIFLGHLDKVIGKFVMWEKVLKRFILETLTNEVMS